MTSWNTRRLRNRLPTAGMILLPPETQGFVAISAAKVNLSGESAAIADDKTTDSPI